MTRYAKRLVLPVVSFTTALCLNAAETALVRVKWSEFVTTDKVDRVMAKASITAKPLGDAQAIPLHDAGKTIVYDWETGDADDLLAAVGVGAEYVRTSRPLEARAIIGAQAAKAGRGALMRDRTGRGALLRDHNIHHPRQQPLRREQAREIRHAQRQAPRAPSHPPRGYPRRRHARVRDGGVTPVYCEPFHVCRRQHGEHGEFTETGRLSWRMCFAQNDSNL